MRPYSKTSTCKITNYILHFFVGSLVVENGAAKVAEAVKLTPLYMCLFSPGKRSRVSLAVFFSRPCRVLARLEGVMAAMAANAVYASV